MNMKLAVTTIITASLLAGGCVTNTKLDERIAASEARTDEKLADVGTQIEDLQEKQRQTDMKIEELSREANEALERANEAGILAKGKVVFEESFTEDRIRFRSGSAKLDDSSRASLDALANRIKSLDRSVWIEIQGHTDATGAEAFNEELGADRAEVVRRYLSSEHGLPLARMSTISYGESSPVAANNTRDGRAQNRRVVIVVLE